RVENLGIDTQNSTQEQLNKLIEFRQVVYDQFFTVRQDVQFELLDALLIKGRVASFPCCLRLVVFGASGPVCMTR
ncbi:MAG: hypothetical protein ACYSSO_10945, partial [Planctomycetota bacterium]